ncbi:hypothetical protein LTR05_005602 [Lithohypha guttulata]|uniref:Kinesin-like protein n=1 Tax=Lithohypha guttulata TaxID=1690604 RepID=A0AAN7YA52_9EURO|nr:hypothetical protein LTR05_005602 [Lithohypha guttulata]
MDSSTSKLAPQTSLFQVFLRLRPPMQQNATKQHNEQQPWLLVEKPIPQSQDSENESQKSHPTHITLQPPNDSRKRAIERFGFTKVFHEEASQLDVFEEIGAVENIQNVLRNGRDGLLATLGVTGSGKSLQAGDPSEAHIIPATTFLESIYSDGERARFSRAQTPMAGIGSRAQTPLMDHIPPTLLARRRRVPEQGMSILPDIEDNLHHTPSPSRTVWERLNPKRTHAKTSVIQESMPMHHARRPPMPRPSTFAHEPDMASYATPIDPHCDYVVLVSMYEVYNDRIFDLLSGTASNGPAISTRQGAALQKSLLRRPLLFKNTEMSPDRKVVAGLKKIVCSSYDEAIMVLETGLTERRVAGTGSNSVSSRSHGFFCIEVKKKTRGNDYAGHHLNQWSGGTLSIVDLAGSERARNAKTTGSTLAEAGKINESLMYLGQCLQVQSDCQQDGTKPIVPFRQCKLTELLFSNSFPSANNSSQCRPPQKAVMIVTADAQGDFNATSQILRYSALAREVTVPRIPSITNAIGVLKANGPSGRNTPSEMPQSYFPTQELEQAQQEISRLTDECHALVVRLTEEEIKRTEVELKFQAAAERTLLLEQEVREECWQEMEAMLEEEKERWRRARDDERINSQEYMDEKLEILEKNVSFKIHEDADTSSRVQELEHENEVLRARLAAIEQELQTRSPTKKKTSAKTPGMKVPKPVLADCTSINTAPNPFLASLMEKEKETIVLKPSLLPAEDSEIFDISPRKLTLRNSANRGSAMTDATVEDPLQPQTPATTKKKTRKLTTRKWEIEDDIF